MSNNKSGSWSSAEDFLRDYQQLVAQADQKRAPQQKEKPTPAAATSEAKKLAA